MKMDFAKVGKLYKQDSKILVSVCLCMFAVHALFVGVLMSRARKM